MTNKIKSIDNRGRSIIENRNAIPSAYTRTVNLNQTDGNFITTFPVENKVVIYGQSPNSSNSYVGASRTISDLDAYGTLDFPIDAKFDYINRKIWIADTGNNRILEINYNTFLVDFEITNVIFPSAITFNPNNGDIFVRGYANLTTGSIYWMDTNGKTIDVLTFDDQFPYETFSITKDVQAGYDLPSPSSISFDHVRSRLWWTTSTTVYMADLQTKNVSSYDLSSEFEFIGPINVDMNSGNSFVGASNEIGETGKFSNVICIYKDNNYILNKMKVALSVKNAELSELALPDIDSGQTSPWPQEFIVSDFGNLSMNGIWDRKGNYRGQIYSYVCPNNTLVLSDSNPSGQYGIGSYIMQPSGKYEWEFIFYKIETYPIISQKWIYRQETKKDKPSGKYILSSYYSADPLVSNPYPDDFGYIDTDEFSDSSLSSMSSVQSESSSSGFETESYEQQIIRTVLADQAGHHNLLPFSYSIDNSSFKNSDLLPFTFSNSNALDYSMLFRGNGVSSVIVKSASNTYVPSTDFEKYTHDNVIIVDAIVCDAVAASSVMTSVINTNLTNVEPDESFVIPRFSWSIKPIIFSQSNTISVVVPGVPEEETTTTPSPVSTCNPYILLGNGFYDPGFGVPYILSAMRTDTCLAVGSHMYSRQIGSTGEGFFHKIWIGAYKENLTSPSRTMIQIQVFDQNNPIDGVNYFNITYLHKQSYEDGDKPIILGDYELAWGRPQSLFDSLKQYPGSLSVVSSTKEEYEASGGT